MELIFSMSLNGILQLVINAALPIELNNVGVYKIKTLNALSSTKTYKNILPHAPIYIVDYLTGGEGYIWWAGAQCWVSVKYKTIYKHPYLDNDNENL